MSTRELITALYEENPSASNAELARMAIEGGATCSERNLRKMASSVKGGTSSAKKPNPTASPMNLQDNIKSATTTANGKELSYKGKQSITSLEEAIEFFEIDTNTWSVAAWTCNSWDAGENTNYQVKVRLERRYEQGIVPAETEVPGALVLRASDGHNARDRARSLALRLHHASQSKAINQSKAMCHGAGGLVLQFGFRTAMWVAPSDAQGFDNTFGDVGDNWPCIVKLEHVDGLPP